MRAIIQLTASGARAFRREPRTGPANDLKILLEELHLSLHPLHPHATDPELMTFFSLDIPDAVRADNILLRFRKAGSVLAAYYKPDDELPS